MKDPYLKHLKLIIDPPRWFPITAEQLATLKAERDELRKALSDLMLVGEYRDLMQGLTVEQLFPHRFKAARAVLAKASPPS